MTYKKYWHLTYQSLQAFWGLNTQAFAHGGKAEMVSLYQNMSEQGAKVVKDDFYQYLYDHQRFYGSSGQTQFRSGFGEWQAFQTPACLY
ncbi:hypothetical protein ABVN80_00275 [Acinetobacter baumannii]